MNDLAYQDISYLMLVSMWFDLGVLPLLAICSSEHKESFPARLVNWLPIIHQVIWLDLLILLTGVTPLGYPFLDQVTRQQTTQLTHNVTTTLHLSCGNVASYTTFTQRCWDVVSSHKRCDNVDTMLWNKYLF